MSDSSEKVALHRGLVTFLQAQTAFDANVGPYFPTVLGRARH
jgi:hypothetical protein